MMTTKITTKQAQRKSCVFDDNLKIFFKSNTYVVCAYKNRLGETILISTNSIGFYKEISEIIPLLSSNIIKYHQIRILSLFLNVCSVDDDNEDKAKKDKEKKLTDHKEERETFDEHDLDKNGVLSEIELLPLLMTNHKMDAENEAEHLIEKADDDMDGQLNYEEFEDSHDLFVGHALTGEGDYLHYVKHKDEL